MSVVLKKAVLFLFAGLCGVSAFAREQIITTSDSVELYVNVQGQGPPCLYIHGGPGAGSYWLEALMGDSLEQHFQMIYLDQRGVGRSSSPTDGNFSMDRMVQDFEEVRKALGIEQWLTLGHSFGGVLQMGYVTQEPKSISALLFINCTLWLEESFEESWLPKAMELAGEKTPKECMDTKKPIHERMMAIAPVLGQNQLLWKMFFAHEANDATMNATYASFTSWNTDFSQRAFELKDYWKNYKKLSKDVKQPVLFFYGTQDWAIGPQHYQGVRFKNLTLQECEVGHIPFLEAQEELLEAIRTFKKRHSEKL